MAKKTSLEQWLAAKRQQHSRAAMVDMSGAPSVAERYGFSKPTNGADRGVLPSGAGYATGYGADGKLQRNMPTDIRQGPGGNRYAVDEGEVVVVNADTVARYGGAQALDRFIAGNAPGGQAQQPQAMGGVQQTGGFRSPSMPFAQGQPQARVAEQVMQQRVPQMATGGVPGRRFGNYGPGVLETAPTGERFGNYGPFKPEPTSKNSGSVTVVPTDEGKGISDEEVAANANAANMVGTYGGGANVIPETPGSPPPLPLDETGGGDNIAPPLEPVTPIAPPLEPVTPTAPVPEGAPVYKPNEIDQAIMNYYSQRTGAAQEAERASEAQALQQQGVSAETQRGVQAMSDISRRQAGAEQTAQMGVEALKGQEERRKYEEGMAITRKAETRAQEQWQQEKINGLEKDFTGYVQTKMTADPNYDWTKDPVAVGMAQGIWTERGQTGTVDTAWGTSLVKAVTVNPADAYVNSVRSSGWYRETSPGVARPDVTEYNPDGTVKTLGKDKIDEGLGALAGMTALGGVSIGVDKKGNVVVRDMMGAVCWSADPKYASSGGVASDEGYTSSFTGDLTDNDAVSAYATAFDTEFMVPGEVSPEAMGAYLASHKDAYGDPAGPASEQEWIDWCKSDRVWTADDAQDAYDIISIDEDFLAAMNGEVTVEGMQLWLAQNGGKIGTDMRKIAKFMETAPDRAAISTYLRNGGVLDTTQQGNLRKMMDARHLLDTEDDYDTPEAWADACRAAGFSGADRTTLQAWADMADDVAPPTGSVPTWTPGDGNQSAVNLKLVPYDTADGVRNDDLLGQFVTGGADTGRTHQHVQVYLTDDLKTWGKTNKGKSITVNGINYVVQGTMANGSPGNLSSSATLSLLTQGIVVYDTVNNKQMVLVPTSDGFKALNITTASGSTIQAIP